jgi:hypothetical protein
MEINKYLRHTEYAKTFFFVQTVTVYLHVFYSTL